MASELNEQALKEIWRLQRDEGIQHLASCFQWKEFEGDYQRQYLHQKFVYDSVMFCVKRGLPWSAVAQVASMTKELLPELKGLERSEVISLIRTRLSHQQLQLSPIHRTALYDFIVEDCVCHHQLYQAFLQGDINIKYMDSHLEIHVPPHPPPLVEGTDVVVWEKQQALQELLTAEAEKQAELQRLREQAKTELMANLQERLGDLSVTDRPDKQEVQSIVRTFLQSQGDVLKDNLEKEILTTQELLEIKMRQTCLLEPGLSPNTSSFSEKQSVTSSTKIKNLKK